MPLLIQALLGALIQGAGTLVGRVLISLGFGYVAYQGMDNSLDWLRSQVISSVGGLPSQAMAVLGALKVGSALSVVLSAYSARLVLRGLTGGVIKKLVLK